MKYKIPLLRPYFDIEEIKEIKNVLDSGWVSQGPKVKEFEYCISKYLDIKYVIAVTNCTSALHLSLLSIGIKQGDEVLVADYTFPATGHAVLYCGAKPVFVDIDIKTYNVDSELIEEKITDKTRAILPVHTFGNPVAMKKILEISREYNLKIIEDAACALGAKYQDKYAGTIGDVGCFSLHARKGITTGEGGLVVTNDKDVADNIRMLSVFGIKSAWEREKKNEFTVPEFYKVGYNYKMSDINAAVGVAQLKKLEKIMTRKRELAKYWDDILSHVDYMEPPFVSNNVKHAFQSYVPLVNKYVSRNKIITNLMRKGVQTNIGTYSSHIQPVYNSKEVCKNSLEVFNRAIALPMYYTLKEHEIEVVAKYLKDI